jgi:oxygen-independent coproporphyrinogen-3 oxidase
VRVSLGVQSFQAGLRAGLGRRAAAAPAGAVARLRAAGVRNLSIDLIHGLPGQSLAGLDDDIGAVLALRPEHVSWYELSLAAGTPLARDTSSLDIPDAETRAAMYRRVVTALQRAGYAWYEVSNFALPGRRARHNVAYWRARPYLGLGPGAVSTVGRSRWTNDADAAAWRTALAAGAPPPRHTEDLDAATRARERLMLAARCGAPVPLAELTTILDGTATATLAAAGLVIVRDGTIRVTRKGRYVADEVCVRLFRD